jgi:hypothetical protein
VAYLHTYIQASAFGPHRGPGTYLARCFGGRLMMCVGLGWQGFGYEVMAVGHCHIDTAWLWPYDETRRKVNTPHHTTQRPEQHHFLLQRQPSCKCMMSGLMITSLTWPLVVGVVVVSSGGAFVRQRGAADGPLPPIQVRRLHRTHFPVVSEHGGNHRRRGPEGGVMLTTVMVVVVVVMMMIMMREEGVDGVCLCPCVAG